MDECNGNEMEMNMKNGDENEFVNEKWVEKCTWKWDERGIIYYWNIFLLINSTET